jgi:hypothetical protein
MIKCCAALVKRRSLERNVFDRQDGTSDGYRATGKPDLRNGEAQPGRNPFQMHRENCQSNEIMRKNMGRKKICGP